jgi:hypothetical protein
MNWYKKLNIFQKIIFKEMFVDLIGIKFSDMSFMFSFKEKIEIGYNKLKIEGFDI